MNTYCSIALAALLAAPLACADYAVQVPLALEGEGPWYRLELPLELQMAAKHTDLRDLRVLNAEGEELAYSLSLGSARAEEQRREIPVRIFPLQGAADAPAAPAIRVQHDSSGTLVDVVSEPAGEGRQIQRGWLLDAGATDLPLHRLLLEWGDPQEGFQRFSIEASDDLQHWQRWQDGQIARLSFADERVEQREVALPGAKARYLRLLWQTPQQAPTQLNASLINIEHGRQTPALAWSAPLPPVAGKGDEYRWELPLSLPLHAVRFELPPGNVLLPVTLASRGAGKLEWRPLSGGLLYRLPQEGREVLQDTIELPGGAVQQLRLRADARGGGFGSQPPVLRVAVRSTRVVFLARGTEPYRLALGDASARSSALPLTTLIPGYEPARLESLGRATAPAEVPATVRQAAADAQSRGDWKRLGLWAVLLVGVALLGGMAFSLLRRPQPSEH